MIITHTKDDNIKFEYLHIFPDQFKTEKEKMEPTYIKQTMDFFATVAYGEYVRNRDSFVKNYDLMNGILRREDFFDEIPTEAKSLTDMLMKDIQLPAYVKHYPILNSPVNTLIGELSKRPDVHRAKALDDDSKSEEFEFKTALLQRFIMNRVKEQLELDSAVKNGGQPDEKQVQQDSIAVLSDQLTDYTSVAEKWSNHVLQSAKGDFQMKRKSESAFGDLLKAAREFFLVDEDTSKMGFSCEDLNPKNVWHLTTPDKEYSKDWYAGGTAHVMEISEIIERFPELDKEEIDHLRSSLENYGLINTRPSNLFDNSTSGIESVHYDTYNPLILQERMMIESEMKDNNDDLRDFLGLTANVSAFGYKYVVVRAYWSSKLLIKKVTFIDEQGEEQTLITDETYKNGSIPTEISVEEGWVNQWYKGLKIGPDVYHMKPFKLLDYCPIIGVIHNLKNTEPRSMVDLMKPLQVLYNVCLNQLYKLFEKDRGKLLKVQIRRIQVPKDGDEQDALDVWQMNAKERGLVIEDDSPENLKSQISNTQTTQVLDMDLSQQIQTRINLAKQLKEECWELIGISRQRVGEMTATETATNTNTAMNQSYAQTEPYFAQHEYVMNDVYQAILDAAQYIESKKKLSTISYVSTVGESAFIQVNGADLKMKDLHVFVTSRPEDQQFFNEIRSLAPTMMQNGGSPYDIIQLYASNSVREMKQMFKFFKDKQEQIRQQNFELEQDKNQIERDKITADIQQKEQEADKERLFEGYQGDLNRENKKEVALIMATAKNPNAIQDVGTEGFEQAIEKTSIPGQAAKEQAQYDIKAKQLDTAEKARQDKLLIEMQKISVARQKMKTDFDIEKMKVENERLINKEKLPPKKSK